MSEVLLNDSLEIGLLNNEQEKRRLQGLVQEYAFAHHWPKAVRLEVELLLEEWITDIIDYAFDDAAEHQIRVVVASEGTDVQIQTEDEGKPFDPLSRPGIDLTVPEDERPIGGLGISMLRRLADEIRYSRVGNKNIVQIRKSVAAPKLLPPLA
jgi:anti-sigma regulatory factor (Ser/Thr protein kinase)